MIGDPDQSIYGFRGSSGRCFERLEEDSPDINIIRLVQNYRSSPEILQTAVPVIEHNPGKPRLLTPNQTSGIAVRLVQTADDFSEGIWIAKHSLWDIHSTCVLFLISQFFAVLTDN